MFCDRCGAKLRDNERFCHACGRALATFSTMPPRSRVAGHIRLLGILWLIISVLRLIPVGVLLLAGTAHLPHFPRHFPMRFGPVVGPVLVSVGGFLVIAALVGFIAGWGLLERRPWARILALVLGCIALLDFPFGTALGIYTLWVLVPSESELEFRRMARPAGLTGTNR